MLFPFSGPGVCRGLPFLFLTLAAAGCGDVNFNPAAPSATRFEPLGVLRTVEIDATLVTRQGGCLEATILYDGRELPDARRRCEDAEGCTRLELAAVARTAQGQHTIALQVLGQHPESVEYVAEARVRASRDGSPGTVRLALGPARVALRSGETVTFDVEFRNWL